MSISCEIHPLDARAMQAARAHWARIAKPLGSLGKLEEMLVRLAGIQRTERVSVTRKRVVVMCADNGIVEEGVTQCTSEVTAQVCESMAAGTSSVCAMANYFGAAVLPVDIGMARDACTRGVRNCKRVYGTNNFLHEPAMTRETAEAAIQSGIDIAAELAAFGCDLLATGEMGIGNTTTASALAAVLLGLPAKQTTGRGAGLSAEALHKKAEVVRRGIELHKPNPADPVGLLSKLGGLDIAGMTGLFLGGAQHRVGVIVDGIISSVAALLACRLDARVRDYLFASHISAEPVAQMLLQALELEPCLQCGMHLGEGTGAVAQFALFDLAAQVYDHAATFAQKGITQYVPLV